MGARPDAWRYCCSGGSHWCRGDWWMGARPDAWRYCCSGGSRWCRGGWWTDARPGGWSCDSGVSPVQAWPVCGWRANHGDQACERKHARACLGAAYPSRFPDACEWVHAWAGAHRACGHGDTSGAWVHGVHRGDSGGDGGYGTTRPGPSWAHSNRHKAG